MTPSLPSRHLAAAQRAPLVQARALVADRLAAPARSVLRAAFTAVAALAAVTLWAVPASPAHAQPAARLLPAQSEVAFVSKQMGVPVEGRFERFDAKIAFDPKQPQTGSVALTIDTGSATLGIPETDAELPKPEWFGVARFPQASFQSTAIKPVGGGQYEVAGQLTIKGQSRPLVVPVSLAQTGTQAIATGSFTIKRLAFRIGEGEWGDTSLVADDVQVRFKLALAGLPPP